LAIFAPLDLRMGAIALEAQYVLTQTVPAWIARDSAGISKSPFCSRSDIQSYDPHRIDLCQFICALYLTA
jgi:hypothetical protein